MSSRSKENPLALRGLRLGSRISRPDSFSPTEAWSTPRYSFQIDLVQGICRRISEGENPDVYVTVLQATPSKKVRRHRLGHRSRKLLKVSLVSVAAAAAFILVYPFYPAAKYQAEKKVAETISHTSALAATPAEISSGNRVMIPKIGVDTAILEGKSLTVLNTADGVWHETGTQASNIVLAGHRFKYLPPNSSTLYNLNQVTAGDTIVLDLEHKRYIYVVTSTESVTKNDIAIRNPSPKPTITIYSCEEVNQAHRIVVHAKLID